jgi:hypothetical protein
VSGIVRLVYTSTIASAARRKQAELLPSILSKAVPRNALLDVSGMLLALGDGFLQVLEGSGPAVDAVFLKVRDDRRHQGVKVLERTPIATREFERWAMCGRDISNADNAILDVLTLRPGFTLQGVNAKDAMKLLRLVKSIQVRLDAAA